MSSEGWIKIHRKLMEWEWYGDPNMVTMWIHLLLSANHKPKQWHGKIIERGQLVTSRELLAISTGLSEQQVRTCIDRLIAGNQIIKQATNKYTLITICKYDEYQCLDDLQQPANNQQITTNNNIEELKNNDEFPIGNSLSGCGAPPTQHPAENINYDKLVAYFNTTTKGVFGMVQMPLSETRRTSVRARIREHGKEAFITVIAKAMASDFLKGQNQRGFKATFDWLIKPTNFEKVLSGNYDNHENTPGSGGYKGDSTIGTEFTRKS